MIANSFRGMAFGKMGLDRRRLGKYRFREILCVIYHILAKEEVRDKKQNSRRVNGNYTPNGMAHRCPNLRL